MTSNDTTPGTQASTAATSGAGRAVPDAGGSTRALLAGGVLAGPLFVGVALAQALTRAGFDLRRHPISLLSLGDLGWIQIANFVVAGVLVLASAVGMRRVLRPGRGRTWGPLLVGLFGVGLVVGGVFVTDPGLGFPAGAPAGIPTERSWHARVHDLAPGLALDAMIVACIVLARRFAGLGHRAWAAAGVATGLAILVLSWWPSLDGISVRLFVAVTLAFAWTSAVSARLIRESATVRAPASGRRDRS
ncbi:MAG TPA: DUF998 domain-containing protein [Cryptosporangiaceae bacterium]|nr:DUF998 domain-containing protein [Cryptosporangiaceae bacterium]